MVEQDKENSSGLMGSTIESPSEVPTEKQLTLFVHKIFFGPIELNPRSAVDLKWTDDPSVSGKISFDILHGSIHSGVKINFEYIEGCFGFISNDHHRHAVIFKFREPSQNVLIRRIMSPRIQDQMNQYQLNTNKDPLSYLTIILNEAVSNNLKNAVAEDEKLVGYVPSQLQEYMMTCAHAKFREDWKLRFNHIRGKHSNEDFCFYDVISQEEFAKFLKKVGIRNERYRDQQDTYVGYMPEPNKGFHLQNSICTATTAESLNKEKALAEFIAGKKNVSKNQPQHQPVQQMQQHLPQRQHVQHHQQPKQHQMQHQQHPKQQHMQQQHPKQMQQQAQHQPPPQQKSQLQPPSLSPLTLEHKNQRKQPSILGKRPRSRVEEQPQPTTPAANRMEVEEEQGDEEMEDEDEEMDEEEGPVDLYD
ncbi:hypothetical protein PFISCL1PPCAC_8036, partial [Pristionchus fissidentatus]